MRPKKRPEKKSTAPFIRQVGNGSYILEDSDDLDYPTFLRRQMD